ncbi:MAG: hypothetical protein ACKVOH_01240 [Chlamydiales bacterium]
MYRQEISALDPAYYHEIPLTIEVVTKTGRTTYFVGSKQFDTYIRHQLLLGVIRTKFQQ